MANLQTTVKKSNKAAYGGIRRKIYYSPCKNITTFPREYADAQTLDENITLQGSFVFKAGFKAEMIEIILKKGQLMSEAIGDALTSSAWKNTLKFSFINNTKEAASLINEMNKPDSEYVFFIPNDDDNFVRVFGDDRFPAIRTTLKDTGGEKVEDGQVCEAEFSSEGPKYRVFKGVVDGIDSTSSNGNGIVGI